MPDIQNIGWGSRLASSFSSVLIGLVMFVVSFPVLFWNEGRAVHRAQDLAAGEAACISVSADKVDDANDGKLVHITGQADTQETLTDPQFKVSAKALVLNRNVEIYQWTERSEEKTEKKTGGGEVKTTSYYHEKKWVDQPIESSGFKPDDGEYRGQDITNRGVKPYADATERAAEVKVGAFKLTNGQVSEMGSGEKVPVTPEMLASLPADLKDKLKVSPDGNFYLPFTPDGNPATPQIGDVRVSFMELKPQVVSIIAKQTKGTFEPWSTAATSGTIDILKPGSVSQDEMFKAAEAENNTLTWILRAVGFIVMAIGISLVFQPLVVFADVLPFLGGLLGAGVGIFAGLIALPLSIITIALAWVTYRPMVGIPLLIAGVGLIVFALVVSRRRKAAKMAG